MPFNFTPEDYDALLLQKTEQLQTLLAPFEAPALQVFASEKQGFRCRAEFRFWHHEQSADYAMFKKGDKHQAIAVTHFPIAHPAIQALMPTLKQAILDNEQLKHKLFQVEFLYSLKGQMLVSLLYHKRLDESWQEQGEALAKALNIDIIGRARKQKIVIGRDYIEEQLEVDGKTYHYLQYEGGFTQPNANINKKMLAFAKQHSQGHSHQDLLELYCGNGNFTAVLAENFRQVLATEISKTSVKAAKFAFQQSAIDNVNIARMSSEEFTEALNGKRQFKRLEQANIQLDDYQFHTVLVDPPRAGLDPDTLALIQQFQRIVYISCNPETLADNLKTLNQTHSITQAALFDQFPYTHHVETGLVLQKRG